MAEQKPSHIQTIAQILQEAEEYLGRTHSVSEWLELEEVLTKAQVELDTIKPQQAALRQVRNWLAGEELRKQQAQLRKLVTEGGPPHEQYDVLTAIQERLTQMQELLRSSKQEQPRKVTRPIPVYLTSSRQEQLRGATGPISLYFDLDNFSPTDIADIIAILSELYADVGGDGLVIDDVTLLDFQPAFVPVEG